MGRLLAIGFALAVLLVGTGAQINGLGDIAQTQELARNLASRPLPLDLVRVGAR